MHSLYWQWNCFYNIDFTVFVTFRKLCKNFYVSFFNFSNLYGPRKCLAKFSWLVCNSNEMVFKIFHDPSKLFDENCFLKYFKGFVIFSWLLILRGQRNVFNNFACVNASPFLYLSLSLDVLISQIIDFLVFGSRRFWCAARFVVACKLVVFFIILRKMALKT